MFYQIIIRRLLKPYILVALGLCILIACNSSKPDDATDSDRVWNELEPRLMKAWKSGTDWNKFIDEPPFDKLLRFRQHAANFLKKLSESLPENEYLVIMLKVSSFDKVGRIVGGDAECIRFKSKEMMRFDSNDLPHIEIRFDAIRTINIEKD